MIRRLIYIVLIAAVFFAPVKRVNVADLEPVEALLLTREGEKLTLTTDTGISGTGADMAQAMEDLRENTPAVLFLDTVEYVALTEAAKEDVEDLMPQLKSRIKLFVFWEKPPDNWPDHLRKKNCR